MNTFTSFFGACCSFDDRHDTAPRNYMLSEEDVRRCMKDSKNIHIMMIGTSEIGKNGYASAFTKQK